MLVSHQQLTATKLRLPSVPCRTSSGYACPKQHLCRSLEINEKRSRLTSLNVKTTGENGPRSVLNFRRTPRRAASLRMNAPKYLNRQQCCSEDLIHYANVAASFNERTKTDPGPTLRTDRNSLILIVRVLKQVNSLL